jgi:hypothetical protein
MIVRLLAIINLILGIIYWTGNYPIPTMVHMGIGVLVVLGVWIISGLVARYGFGLAVAGFVLGLVAMIYGASQSQMFIATGGNIGLIHLIKLGHVILIFLVLGLAEAANGKIKRAATA